jgi:hypothetical protein
MILMFRSVLNPKVAASSSQNANYLSTVKLHHTETEAGCHDKFELKDYIVRPQSY